MAISSRIGTQAKTIRETRGLSVTELGARSGCSVELIEAIENGGLAPSIAPLVRVARALGVRLGTLMDGAEQEGPAVDRAEDRTSVARYPGSVSARNDGSAEYCGLALAKPDKHVDPFILTLKPGANATPSCHEGEEFLFVLSGTVEVTYGKQAFVLERSDSIYIDSVVPHCVAARGDAPAELLSVIYTPV